MVLLGEVRCWSLLGSKGLTFDAIFIALSRVAQIGGHTVYKIMDTCMVPIPNETVRKRYHHDNESK